MASTLYMICQKVMIYKQQIIHITCTCINVLALKGFFFFFYFDIFYQLMTLTLSLKKNDYLAGS